LLGAPGASRFGFLTVPLSRLAETAAGRLDAVHLRAPVSRLQLSFDRAASGLWTAEGSLLRFDGFVLALPPDRLASLLGVPAQFGLPPLDGFASRPVVDVHLWHDGGPLGFDFAALLASPVQW